MSFVLSLIIASSLSWIIYLCVCSLENANLRAKWFATLSRVQEEGILLSWNRGLLSLLAPFFKRACFEKYFPPLEKKLESAGLRSFISSEEFVAWSFALFFEMAFLTLLFFGASPIAIIMGAAVGLVWPWVWLFSKQKERVQNIRKDLPLVMDLLAVSVSAGMDMTGALQRIVKNLPAGALKKEFEILLQDLKLGQSRKEAFLLLKKRVPIFEIQNLVSLLTQSMQLGSPLAPVLLSFANHLRTLRFMQAEKAGIEASQKILFPLILCIMPAVFLMIFAPLLIRFFLEGFGGFL
ncbi:MAG: type II secretion system F family protein [Deltaproteobacteria bacterium]|nr:type II secretion system F family protein [Deltaproteobacteria bacterium]